MIAKPGYYSLIQFCPDRARMEAVNVGVLLYCPDLDYLEVALAANDDYVCKVFGRDRVNLSALRAAKESLAFQLRSNADKPRSLEELQHFSETRGNDLLITAPRAMRVEEPNTDLATLRAQLVDREQSLGRTNRSLSQEAEYFFGELVKKGRAKRNYSAVLPVLNRRIRFPFAYENGALNLVKPEYFSDNKSAADQKAARLATTGKLFALHGSEGDGRGTRLVILATFAEHSSHPEIKKGVLDLLREFDVHAVPSEQFAAFAEEVRREVHR